MFEDKKIDILAYNLETILAEKLHTILSRGIASTRLRDYYDLWILHKLKENEINKKYLKEALLAITQKRETPHILNEYSSILNQIKNDKQISTLWSKYQKEYSYAQGVELNAICDLILEIMDLKIIIFAFKRLNCKYFKNVTLSRLKDRITFIFMF